jgi:drug/metabolite transporter (DMT)-like permease
MPSFTNSKSHHHGRVYAVLSGLLYSLLGFFGLKLINSGITAYNLSFWRFLTAWIFLAIIFLIKKPKIKEPKKEIFKAMLNGMLFYTAPSSMFFLACTYIGTGQALVIFFVFPLWVVLINYFLGRQSFKRSYFFSFILTLAGLLLLVELGDFKADLWGIGLSILASVFYAFYIVFNKDIKLSAMSSSLSVLFSCTIICGLIAYAHGSFLVPHDEQILNMIILGIICTALPVLLLFLALKHISSEEAAFLAVLEPVFAVIFGILLLGEAITFNTFFGIIFILLGALSVSVDWQAWFLKKQKN